jgi:hypothetical protein
MKKPLRHVSAVAATYSLPARVCGAILPPRTKPAMPAPRATRLMTVWTTPSVESDDMAVPFFRLR